VGTDAGGEPAPAGMKGLALQHPVAPPELAVQVQLGHGAEIAPPSSGGEIRPRQNPADILQIGESDGAFRVIVRHCREGVDDFLMKPEQLGACQAKQFV
jgi:hypothetical protein